MAEILIIGGGAAGLSAGVYAQLHGHRATVCEQQPVAGGNLTGWRRGGYTIDNCIHWLSGTNPATPTYRMWRELGVLRGGDVYQGQTLYTVEHGGLRLSLRSDLERMEQELLVLSPADAPELRRLFRAVRFLQYLNGCGGPSHDRGLLHASPLSALPGLLDGYRCSVETLALRFRHPAIRAFLQGFWGSRFGALALLVVMADYASGNGGLPRGGSKAMAAKLQARFLSLGGRLELGARATGIERQGGRARAAVFADGARRAAEYYVLCAEPTVSFSLLGLPLPSGYARSLRFSSLHCAFACQTAALPFRGDLVLPPAPDGTRLTVREFSHEPGFAPAGSTVLQTLRFCGEAEARSWIALRSGDPEGYRRKKQALAASAERALLRSLPQLSGGLRCLDVWTPATYSRYTGAETGSYLSSILPPHTLPRKRSPRIPGLSNVLLATQWQQSPGGLPIAAERGKAAVEAIDRLCR